jgi:hypothetical protein
VVRPGFSPRFSSAVGARTTSAWGTACTPEYEQWLVELRQTEQAVVDGLASEIGA